MSQNHKFRMQMPLPTRDEIILLLQIQSILCKITDYNPQTNSFFFNIPYKFFLMFCEEEGHDGGELELSKKYLEDLGTITNNS